MKRLAEELAASLRGHKVTILPKGEMPEEVKTHLREVTMRSTPEQRNPVVFGHRFGLLTHTGVYFLISPQQGSVTPAYKQKLLSDLQLAEPAMEAKKVRAVCSILPGANFAVVSFLPKGKLGWLGRRRSFISAFRKAHTAQRN